MKRTETEDKNRPSLPSPDNHRPVNLHTPSLRPQFQEAPAADVEEAEARSGELT